MESLGILRLEGLVYYVHDASRSHKFYVERLDFAHVGNSSEDYEQTTGMTTKVYQAGNCQVTIALAISRGNKSFADRFLTRHPDGIGELVFEVADIEQTLRVLESRGAAPVENINTIEEGEGIYRSFAIATPFGSSLFRFVQRDNYTIPFPGCNVIGNTENTNKYGFTHFDHITSNFETMAPALLWMQHVMGLERYWGIEFHTSDIDPTRTTGSGLKSTVMWDPESKVKFANNEPWRPFFTSSQISLFVDDNRGDGIQHAAIAVGDIIPAVVGLRESGVEFLPTPGAYYDFLPQRLQESGIQEIEESHDVLRNLEILIDGSDYKQYLLQIFMKDSAGLYNEMEAGPFFYEIIQRKGDKGFGGGNFRALFESIERQQQVDGRI
jgi:4-hydroxyphenylpyruvate dioxygenase